MKKLICMSLALFLLTLYGLTGCAKNEKVYRVGVISGSDFFYAITDGFKTRMSDLGYIEGKNILYDIKKFNFDKQGEELAAGKFVKDQVDLIISFPTEATLIAKKATKGTNIPVVFAVSLTEGNNLVESIEKPGGNITGITNMVFSDYTAKRLEILHEILPEAGRIYVIYETSHPITSSALKGLEKAAQSLGIRLIKEDITTGEKLQAALVKLNKRAGDIDAIFTMPGTIITLPDNFTTLVKFSRIHKIPIDATLAPMVDRGALLNYATNNIEIGQQAAVIADKILKGTPAGTIPVTMDNNHLRINYKVAQEYGIKIPESILRKASEIIK